MRIHGLHRFTGLIAAAIVTLTGAAVTPTATSTTAAAGTTAAAIICPHGTHWDKDLQACV